MHWMDSTKEGHFEHCVEYYVEMKFGWEEKVMPDFENIITM